MAQRQIGFVFSNCLFGLLFALAPNALAQDAPTPSPLSPHQQDLSRKGDAQLAASNPDAAIATWRSLLDTLTSPEDKADVWSRIGEAYRRKGDLPESLRSLQRAGALVPGNASVITNMGMLYEAQHDPARARRAYEHALELLPDNPLALNNLALLMSSDASSLPKALEYALHARRLMPESMQIVDTVGWIYLQQNKPANAAEQFKTAVTASAANPEFHYHYAMALHRQGKTADAARECRAALDHSPGDELRHSIRQECDPK
jgi:tetratricopeptide (TPR) repeat protein